MPSTLAASRGRSAIGACVGGGAGVVDTVGGGGGLPGVATVRMAGFMHSTMPPSSAHVCIVLASRSRPSPPLPSKVLTPPESVSCDEEPPTNARVTAIVFTVLLGSGVSADWHRRAAEPRRIVPYQVAEPYLW